MSLLLSVICKKNVLLQIFLPQVCYIYWAYGCGNSWEILARQNIRQLAQIVSKFSWVYPTYLLGFIIYDTEFNLTIDSLNNILLSYSNNYLIFFIYLTPTHVSSSYRARSDRYNDLDIFHNKYVLHKYWHIDQFMNLVSFSCLAWQLPLKMFLSIICYLFY